VLIGKHIFIIFLSLFVIKNFRGTCTSVKTGQVYMTRESLGTPALVVSVLQVRNLYSSVYIINSLLEADYTCSWVLSAKPRLVKSFFHDFMRLRIKGGLHFFICLLYRKAWRFVFPWLRFVDQTLISHCVLFSITCTSITWGIIINRSQW